MKKELLTSVCALSLLFGATTAFAGAYGDAPEPEEAPAAPPATRTEVESEEVDYARVGPYIGVGGDYAIELFDETELENASQDLMGSPAGSVQINANNSSGFHVRAGYRVHPNVAVEALYEHFFQFNVDGDDSFGDHTHGRISAWSTTANVKGYVLTGRWQPYALLGLGYLEGDGFIKGRSDNAVGAGDHGSQTDGGFMMRFGAGVDACITENWAMGPEVAYVLPFGDVEDFDFITIALGLRYKF